MGTVRIWAAGIALMLLAACDVPPPSGATADPDRCVQLFRQYDAADIFGGSLTIEGRTRDRSASLGRVTSPMYQLGCVTFARDLDLDALSVADHAPRRAGAAIRPIHVHLGAINSPETRRAVTEAFAAIGWPVVDRPAPELGRRLYAGPVATDGDLARLQAAARDAGFVGVYPARY